MQLPWDWPDPYVLELEVRADEIDEFKHVNNAVYVQWMEDCAWQHSASLGLDFASYQALDRGMAVLRHEIDYLAPAFAGEQLQLATWLVQPKQRLKMDRLFQLVRPADGAVLLRARTTFVCLELSSGRPKRMPEQILQGYARAWQPLDGEEGA